MTDIKGPAIYSETFRVEGHCCGIRIPALMSPTGQGVRFEISPAVRAELLEAGIQPPQDPTEPPQKTRPAG
jgi:hypothetical protein